MKLLGEDMKKLAVRGVVQGLGGSLKAAQALRPSHAGKLKRILEDAVKELLALRIAVDHSTNLKAHQLRQHSHTSMAMKSMLRGVHESITPDRASARIVITTGNYQPRRNKRKITLLLSDVYWFFSLELPHLLRAALISS